MAECVGGGDDRRRVVDRRARPEAEAVLAHSEQPSQGREDDDGDDVEDEYRRDRVGDLGLRRLDDPRHGRDRRRATDPGADTDERAQARADPKCPPDHGSAEQRDRERPEHHGQRPRSDSQDVSEPERAPEQDDRELEQHRCGERHAGRRTGGRPADERRDDAEQDGEHGRAEERDDAREAPCRKCDRRGPPEPGEDRARSPLRHEARLE